MKVVDIIPRQICVKIELTDSDCKYLLSFFEKCIPLYAKVHLNSVTDDSLSGAEEFKSHLASAMKLIEKETREYDS